MKKGIETISSDESELPLKKEEDKSLNVERKSRSRSKALSWKTNQECLEVQVQYFTDYCYLNF